MTGLLTDPLFLEHDTGAHPECKERLQVILEHLPTTDLWTDLKRIPGERASNELIELVHNPEYITFLEEEIESGRPYISTPDCMVSPKTIEVARTAVGGSIRLTEKVLSGEFKNGFALVRPPGHHAEKNQAMGFCYFNNIAICAEYLTQTKKLNRVLIIDFDVHHGNGTQHIFEDRKEVLYCSIHQDPLSCFPGTGFVTETGVGEGKGYTLNVPVPSGAGDEIYLDALKNIFLPAWKEFKPEFIFISAGFDAHRDDPLAGINITEKTYRDYTREICNLAATACNGKVVSLLEGGYNLQKLPLLAETHLRELVQAPTTPQI